MSRIAAEFHFPGMTQEQYDQVIGEFNAAEAADPSLADGRVIHVAMPEEGGMFAFDVWETAEAFGRLGEVLGPLFAKHGIAMTEPTIYPVHNTLA